MGTKAVAFAASAGAVIGMFVGVGLGYIVAGKPGQRTSGQASAILAMSAGGAALGAYVGGYAMLQHEAPQLSA